MNEEIEHIQTLYNVLVEFFVNYSFQLLGAVIIFLLGLVIANKVAAGLQKTFIKHNVDVTLSGFLAGIVRVIILAVVVIIVLNKIGISITPLIAAIGAVSIGAGLAVQGLLSNYAAGVSIIIMRPFVVGDTVKVQDVKGIVKEITLAFTILLDEDETEITIPNKHIIGEIFHNSQELTVVEGVIGVAYDSDVDNVISTIKGVLSLHQLDELKPVIVGIDEFGDSSINFSYRYWVKTGKYHQTRVAVNLDIFNAFSDKGINIPFPQRHVTLINKD